jgi:hypothetical protein
MKFSPKDHQTAARYDTAEPKQFGTLHERMKYLIALGRECRLWEMHNDVWQAIWDLETEVKYHEPASPPFGHRTVHLRDL